MAQRQGRQGEATQQPLLISLSIKDIVGLNLSKMKKSKTFPQKSHSGEESTFLALYMVSLRSRSAGDIDDVARRTAAVIGFVDELPLVGHHGGLPAVEIICRLTAQIAEQLGKRIQRDSVGIARLAAIHHHKAIVPGA